MGSFRLFFVNFAAIDHSPMTFNRIVLERLALVAPARSARRIVSTDERRQPVCPDSESEVQTGTPVLDNSTLVRALRSVRGK